MVCERREFGVRFSSLLCAAGWDGAIERDLHKLLEAVSTLHKEVLLYCFFMSSNIKRTNEP